MKFIRVLKAMKVTKKETYDYKGTIINYSEHENEDGTQWYHVFINGEYPIGIEGKTKEEVLKSAVKFLNHKKFDEMPKKIS